MIMIYDAARRVTCVMYNTAQKKFKHATEIQTALSYPLSPKFQKTKQNIIFVFCVFSLMHTAVNYIQSLCSIVE